MEDSYGKGKKMFEIAYHFKDFKNALFDEVYFGRSDGDRTSGEHAHVYF